MRQPTHLKATESRRLHGGRATAQLLASRARHLTSDRLWRNSTLLLLSTGLTAALGFAFWALTARTYSADAVGEGAALFAVVNFVASFSLLGLNAAMLRFLPTSEEKDQFVSTALVAVSLAALTGAVIWTLARPLLTPGLSASGVGLVGTLATVLLFVGFSVNVAIDSVFLAHGRADYILLKNGAVAVLRISLLFVFPVSGGYGIFVIATVPSVAGTFASILLLARRLDYRLRPQMQAEFLRRTGRFSGGNYLAMTFSSLPAMVVPLMLAGVGESADAAYFYVSLSIANLVYVGVISVNLPFLAEGARAVHALAPLLRRVATINAVVVGLPIIITVAAAGAILSLFGDAYAHHSTALLKLLVATALFMSVSQVVGVILNLQGRVMSLMALSLLNAGLVIGLVATARHGGLTYVGLGWLAGNAFTSVLSVVVLHFDRRPEVNHGDAPKIAWTALAQGIRPRKAAEVDKETT